MWKKFVAVSGCLVSLSLSVMPVMAEQTNYEEAHKKNVVEHT